MKEREFIDRKNHYRRTSDTIGKEVTDMALKTHDAYIRELEELLKTASNELSLSNRANNKAVVSLKMAIHHSLHRNRER